MASLHISAITGLGVLLICGYFCGQLARRLKLPALIGYLAAGVLLGPSMLAILAADQIEKLGFITEISLGCIAFIIGSELQLSSLQKLGKGIVFIILTESLLAFAMVVVTIYLLTDNLPLALLFGAMAPASAPAGTVAVIQEYKAKGPLTKGLYAVVGFDDGLAVIIFGITLAVAKILLVSQVGSTATLILSALGQVLIEISLSLGLGALIGTLFFFISRSIRQPTDRLIIIFWAIFTAIGLAQRWHLSPILTCMTVGFLLVNISDTYLAQENRAPLQQLMGLIFTLFFGLAGLHLDVTILPQLGLIGISYIGARIMGKLLGAWLGAKWGQMGSVMRRYLGLGILSQAGVAIGLALLIQQELAQVAGAEQLGILILSTITATSIIFEIIGPLAAKYALYKAGEVNREKVL